MSHGRRMKSTRVALGLLLGALAAAPAAACSSSSSSDSAKHEGAPDGSTTAADAGTAAVLTGPVTGPGMPFTAAPIDLASMGYVEEEYFLEGEATAYDFQSPPGDDGVWSVKTTTKAPYKTRLLVRRPTDPARFNGSVFVE